MAFQSAPEMAEAVIQCSFGGVAVANVLNFKKLFTPYDQTDIDNLAAAVDATVGSDYLGIIASDVTYSGTLVRGLENVLDLTAFDNTNAGAGALTADSLPANVTLCATLRTGLTGRSARGRFYMLPTVVTNMTTPNTFSGATGTGLTAFLDAVIAAALVQDWQSVVLSRFTGGAKRTTAIGTRIISVEVRNLTSDSQRGRLPSGH